jgi:hypothetical protein
MGEHAKLSPSQAKRWLACPGSVQLASEVVEASSTAADNGTAGHTLFERSLRLGKRPRFWLGERFNDVPVTQEMVEMVEEAVTWVKAYRAKNPSCILYTEEKVNIGPALDIPGDALWGTADLFILTKTELVVFDLKLGYVPVEVESNPQLELYGLGFHHQLGGIYDQVRFVIHQPRAGGAKEFVMPTRDLAAKASDYSIRAKLALDPDAPLIPGDDQCAWCPAAAMCPELQKHALAVAQQEFAPVHTLQRDQLLLLLDRADGIRAFLQAVELHAKKLLTLGQEIPGWKVVAGNKHRAWKDEKVAYTALKKLTKDENAIAPRVLVSPAQAEKLVGKEVVQNLAHKPPGEPTLVRSSDKRPALPPEFTLLE